MARRADQLRARGFLIRFVDSDQAIIALNIKHQPQQSQRLFSAMYSSRREIDCVTLYAEAQLATYGRDTRLV